MTFPSVVAATTYQSATSDATTWAAYSGVNVEKGSIFVASCGRATTFSTSSPNWTKLGEQFSAALGSGGDVDSAVFYKTANAASDSLTIDTTDATQFTGILLRVSGGGIVGGASQADTDNPPNLALSGTRDVLWVALICAGWSEIASAAPSGYSGLTRVQGLTANAASTSLAYRSVSASSQNPGAFSGISADGGSAWTLALYASRNRRSSGFL